QANGVCFPLQGIKNFGDFKRGWRHGVFRQGVRQEVAHAAKNGIATESGKLPLFEKGCAVYPKSATEARNRTVSARSSLPRPTCSCMLICSHFHLEFGLNDAGYCIDLYETDQDKTRIAR